MRRIAIVGATGYTGQELLRMLRRHPAATVAVAMSSRNGKNALPSQALGIPIVPFDPELLHNVDGAFLCTPNGVAAELAGTLIDDGVKVVDLSADFRLRTPGLYRTVYGRDHPRPGLLAEAVYGLTERGRAEIRVSRLVANPGCYPTAILLGLAPLLAEAVVDCPAGIVADCKSGVSGAGKEPTDRTVFGAVTENCLAYGVGTHRHLPEIWQEAATEQIVFVPHLLPVFRGMLATLYLRARNGCEAGDMRRILKEVYGGEMFIRLYDRGQPELRDVRGTNECHIAVGQVGERVVITVALDNLGKGAAGQALQNMNLMLGVAEDAGLAN